MASPPGPRPAHEPSPLSVDALAAIVKQVTVEQVDSVEPADEEPDENQENSDEEEEEVFVVRRSTRVRKPVILARPPPPPPKRKPKQTSGKEKNEEESSSLSDEEGTKEKEQSVVKKRRKSTSTAKKSKTANKEESDAKDKDGDDAMNEDGKDGKENNSVEKPKRKRKRVTEEAVNEDQAIKGEQGDEPPPKKKRASKKAKTDGEGNVTADQKITVKGETQTQPPNGDAPAPKKRVKKVLPTDSKEKDGDSKSANKATKTVDEATPQVNGDEETKKKRKRKPKEETDEAAPSQDGQLPDGQATNGVQGEGDEPAKKKRSRKPKEPVVYVIPDVERKQTTFRGRLGYACINTVLRAQKPAIFTSRTCRMDTIEKNGIDFVKELGRQNVKDLIPIIEWNEKNNIRFMRMSSDMFPFASHQTHGYSLEYCAEELKAAGDLAKKYGHRLSMHPGQYTQLGSPKENVVEASIKELEYHAELMDRMGLDQDSVMIIHMGGTYNDKAATMARFKKVFTTMLSDAVKRRLVLENDEMGYTCDDLLTICPQLSIPIVFDYHHDNIHGSRRPRSELIPIINQTWHARGMKPKQHLSEARPGAVTAVERRAHADRVTEIPADCPDDMDLMIEAKDKEQAVFELYRIYGLHEVIHENLRPPKENQGLRTEGRKSSGVKKPRKSQQEGAVAAPVEPAIIDPEMIDELADDDDL